MPLVDLEKIPQVAVEFINTDHREEGRLLNELLAALAELRAGKGGLETVRGLWDGLHRHTVAHFAREEEAMVRTGFPAFTMHQGEHERVLAEMRREADLFERTGDVERLWRYVGGVIPTWFVQHILTMDQVTAGYLAAEEGAPLSPHDRRPHRQRPHVEAGDGEAHRLPGLAGPGDVEEG